MPQSLAAVTIHFVFSTKCRQALIEPETLQDLHAYLGGIARSMGCAPMGIGGTADHVHALVRLGRTQTISTLVREMKARSSAWIKPRRPDFAWQAGYGAFSFSQAELQRLQAYVSRQAEHHAKASFQDELRRLLGEADLEWDEAFIWD